MRLERVMTVTPPLALRLNRGTDGNKVGTCESGSPDKLVRSVEAKGLQAYRQRRLQAPMTRRKSRSRNTKARAKDGIALPDTNYFLWRVCDRRKQSRFPASPRKMCVERSGTHVWRGSREQYKTRRSLTEEARLLTLYLERSGG